MRDFRLPFVDPSPDVSRIFGDLGEELVSQVGETFVQRRIHLRRFDTEELPGKREPLSDIVCRDRAAGEKFPPYLILAYPLRDEAVIVLQEQGLFGIKFIFDGLQTVEDAVNLG